MSLFEADIDPQRKAEIEATIAKRLEEQRTGGADPSREEQERIGDVLDYGRREYESITYDMYNARRFVRMFPDDAESGGGPFGWAKRFYQRVVRRLLRQQIVFNEAVLGVLEDLDERLKALEGTPDDPKNES